tara:strand:- start:336 stop:569 length:234 start_codon:yes stop_codon:yes gene_type:complete
MATNYSAIKITNGSEIPVSTTSSSTGATEIDLMGATNHDFISVSIDDATNTITGITSAGTTIVYQKRADNLSIAFVN